MSPDYSPSKAEFDKFFEPYACEIGFITREWNMLQDALCQIFATTVNRRNLNVGHAVWNSMKSDRAQREALKAACLAPIVYDKLPKAREDITWLLDQVNKYEDRRNDAIHAPLIISYGYASEKFEVEPWTFHNNPRAQKLAKSDLLPELKWYRAVATELRQFANALHGSLHNEKHAWPQRPQLPTRGQSPTHKPKHHQTGAK